MGNVRFLIVPRQSWMPTPLKRGKSSCGNRQIIWKLFLCLTLPASLPANAEPGTIQFQSASAQTALLELYTSEGCSRCPPAEAWLTGLQNSPRLWKDFAPVAFHVDYWNDLG
jgi:hypothetical protein